MDSPERAQLVQDIMEQSMWLMKMMENILSMTRSRAGSSLLIRVREVVDDVINEASPSRDRLKGQAEFPGIAAKGGYRGRYGCQDDCPGDHQPA